MIESEEDFIDKYLQEKLTEEETLGLQEKLKNDKSFEAGFRVRLASKMAIQEFFKEEIKTEFQEWEKEIEPKNTKVISIRRNKAVLAVAASIALIFTTILLFLNTQKTNPDELFLTYHQKYPNYVESVERGENDKSTYTKAFYAYEQNNFKEAIVLFEKLKAENSQNKNIQFYLGLSYLENKNYQKANQELTTFLKNPNKNFEEVAQWYLALTYLKLDKVEHTKEVLQKIKQKDGDYAQKAVNLLNEL